MRLPHCQSPIFTVLPTLLLLSIAISISSQSQAAAIRLGNVVPGTLVIKDIQSIRERRYENLIEQQTDFSCGAAAVGTLLKYAYGRREVTENQV